MGNSLGVLFKVTSFGESHGPVIGTLIDGCPAGLPLNEADLETELKLRQPDAAAGGTARLEEDRAEILSGIFDGHTTGAPLCLITRNRDVDSGDYQKNRFLPRPGHADYTAYVKYGGFNDYRGGGRFSGRITAGFVMAGAVAKKLLSKYGIETIAHVTEIGRTRARPLSLEEIKTHARKSVLRCADGSAAREMESAISRARADQNSLGGIIEAIALNVPAGLGEPVFDTVEGELSKAFYAIPAIKGVEFGLGFASARKMGSENNDPFVIKEGRVTTSSNNSGGILGGITTGMPLVARVAVKPVASIAMGQQTVDLQKSTSADLTVGGRHDACIVPRAVVVVEAMTAVVLADLMMRAGRIPGVLKWD